MSDSEDESMSGSASDSSTGIIGIEKQVFMHEDIMDMVYADLRRDYYASRDWSIEFYVLQAIRGFIAVGHVTPDGTEIILPQIQTSYCIFDWEKIPENRRLLNQIESKLGNYRFCINNDPENLLREITNYHGRKSWLCDQYKALFRELFDAQKLTIDHLPERGDRVIFRLCSVELYDDLGNLVAGELGYVIGSVFTSLTGFCRREKKVSIGKVQILALAKVLSDCGFAFLNLGQPPQRGCMQYKADLGGVEVPRHAFLDRWNESITHVPRRIASFLRVDASLSEIFPS